MPHPHIIPSKETSKDWDDGYMAGCQASIDNIHSLKVEIAKLEREIQKIRVAEIKKTYQNQYKK